MSVPPETRAVYTEPALPIYRGNPFLEALPAVLERRDLIRALTHRMAFREADRALPAELRIALIQALWFLHVPMPQTLKVSRRLSRLVRTGYIHRNPVDPAYSRIVAERTGALSVNAGSNGLIRTRASPLSRPLGQIILGVSGIGKTTAVQAGLSLLPQLIIHSKYQGRPFPRKQLVWLHLRSPSDVSLKSLCVNFIESVDEVADTAFTEHYPRTRRTVEQLIPAIGKICSHMGVGVLVFDELEHLAPSRSGGERRILNFFVQLSNTVHVPIVLVGTPAASDLLARQFRQARRWATFGDLLLPPMRNDRPFRQFVRGLWRYQYVRRPVPLTDRLLDALHEHSAGITGVVVTLYLLAQIRGIERGEETFSVATIKNVAADSAVTLAPMIEALRTQDMETLRKAEDLLVKRIDGVLPCEPTRGPSEPDSPGRPLLQAAARGTAALQGVDIHGELSRGSLIASPADLLAPEAATSGEGP